MGGLMEKDIKEIVDDKLREQMNRERKIQIRSDEMIHLFIYNKLTEMERNITTEDLNRFFDTNFDLTLNENQSEILKMKIQDFIKKITERECSIKLQRFGYNIERRR